MADLVNVLRAELVGLESELQADPRYQKMAKIRELLAMYDTPTALSVSGLAAPSPKDHRAPGSIGGNPRGRPNSLTTQVLEASALYLRRKGARAPTSEVTDACVRTGVPLPGPVTKQRDYVSSILSHSPLIDNVRGEGYGLAEWSQSHSPVDPASIEVAEQGLKAETLDSSELSSAPKLNGMFQLSV